MAGPVRDPVDWHGPSVPPGRPIAPNEARTAQWHELLHPSARQTPRPRQRPPGIARHRAKRKRRHMPLWQEVPLLLLIAFCLAVLIRTFLVQAFFIPSGSMENTLQVGDRVLVLKFVYDVRQPARGEVVVFRGTDRWAPEHETSGQPGFLARVGRGLGDLVGMSQPGEKDFIKRVVGLPGDVVACCNVAGHVTVNGYALNEPYVLDDSPLDPQPSARECRSRRFSPVTVPDGQIFVMGDHRAVSQDSRCQGTVPIDNVIGRAVLVVWPASRWKSLAAPDTFRDVPRPSAAPAHGLRSGPASPPARAPVVLLAPLLVPFVTPAGRRSWVRRRRRLPA